MERGLDPYKTRAAQSYHLASTIRAESSHASENL